MRRTSTLTVPVGRGWHDHACWFHAGRDEWCQVLVPFVGEGLARNEKILYLADRDEDDLIDDLKALPERDELLRTGQVAVVSMESPRGGTGGPSLADQLALIEHAVDEAKAAGYSGLRIAAESAPPIQSRADAERFVNAELAADKMIARLPLSVLCGYDGRFVDHRAAAALAFVHPVRQHDTFGVGTGLYADPDETDTWRVHGELDLASRDVFEIALAAVPVHGDLHLRLDELGFIDVGGVHALAELADRISPRRLVLHDAPLTLRRILELSRDDFPSMRQVDAGV